MAGCDNYLTQGWGTSCPLCVTGISFPSSPTQYGQWAGMMRVAVKQNLEGHGLPIPDQILHLCICTAYNALGINPDASNSGGPIEEYGQEQTRTDNSAI